jgi:tellurite resistance protein
MSREVMRQARRDRMAALLDAMVLAASADGNLAPVESRQLIERMIERPEFEGVESSEMASLVEAAAKRLSQAPHLEAILRSLVERLPDHRSRVVAFGLASAVAIADQRATREELGLLKALQSSLRVTEDEVSRIFVTLQENGSLAEALGEPLEQLYAETMVLVSAADGSMSHDVMATMLENLAGDPVFRDVSLERAQSYFQLAVSNLTAEGLAARIEALGFGLSTHQQRKQAFQLAVRVAYSQASPSPASLSVLDQLQATFGLPDAEVARMTVES